MPGLALLLGLVNTVPTLLVVDVPGPPQAASPQPVIVAATFQAPADVPAPPSSSQPPESALPGDAAVSGAAIPPPAAANPAQPGAGDGDARVLDQAPDAEGAVSGAIVVAPSQESAAKNDSLVTGFRFTVAPVRWNGNLAYNLSWTRENDAPARVRHVGSGNLRGSTYIWQPWLAQVYGGIGLVTGTENSSGEGVSSGSEGKDTSIVGDLGLALFPASRFPFSASFERTDSRATGAFVGSDYTDQRFSLRQDYTPLRAPFSFAGGYDRSTIEDSKVGRDTVDVLRGGMTWRGDRQSASLNLSQIENRGERGTLSGFSFGNARHNWQSGPELGVDSTANITRSETRGAADFVASAAAPTVTTVTFDLGTSAYWRPDTDDPLSFAGYVRFFRTNTETGLLSSDSQALTAGLSGTYSPTSQLTLSGSAQVTQSRTGENSDVLGLLTAGASYSGEPRMLGEFDYTWNTSGNGSLETGGADGNSTTADLSAAHSISRNFVTGERSNVAVSVFQNVSAISASAAGNTVSLGNSLSASWNLRQSESFVTTVSAGASDSRFFGDDSGSAQQLSLQINGNLYISRYSSATAAITLQAIREEREDLALDGGESGFTGSVYGSLAYQHMRAFGVRQLRYSALYAANTQELGSRRQGNLAALPQGAVHSLEQRLDYRVGRLDLQALLRFSIIEGEDTSFLFFSINREFGAL